jgi:hypothetical protein
VLLVLKLGARLLPVMPPGLLVLVLALVLWLLPLLSPCCTVAMPRAMGSRLAS